MSDMKIITVRLPSDMLEQIDELASNGYENRTNAIRYLISDGLEKNFLLERIGDLEESLTRISEVQKVNYSLAYLVFRVMKEKSNLTNEYVNELIAQSETALAKALIQKFGK